MVWGRELGLAQVSNSRGRLGLKINVCTYVFSEENVVTV